MRIRALFKRNVYATPDDKITILNGKIGDMERRITQLEQKVKTLEEHRPVSSRVHGALGDKTDELEHRVSALEG